MCVCSAADATISALLPRLLSATLAEAPRLISSRAIGAWPFDAAHQSAVLPWESALSIAVFTRAFGTPPIIL